LSFALGRARGENRRLRVAAVDGERGCGMLRFFCRPQVSGTDFSPVSLGGWTAARSPQQVFFRAVAADRQPPRCFRTGNDRKDANSNTETKMLLMIDNYDSFTYNLVQYFGELGAKVKVYRNDDITVEQIAAMKPSLLVVSPGPCSPAEAGVSVTAIREFAGKLPILGVCLGHQSIGAAFGGRVVRAKRPMHGKLSPVRHNDQGVFAGLPNPLVCTRYHSLAVERESLPDCLDVTAWTDDGEIMGLRHRSLDIEGVQFHPESILSQQGHELLRNFVRRA